jgi:hypothetical protein
LRWVEIDLRERERAADGKRYNCIELSERAVRKNTAVLIWVRELKGGRNTDVLSWMSEL